VINMRQLELSEAQLKNLLVLLDKELRSSGLDSLATVVDLYNLLVSTREVREESASEEVVPSSK
jgi:hypothetical protein